MAARAEACSMMIVFLVMVAIVAVALVVELASPRDLDDRERRRWWPGATR
jgi:hypothetical protein